MGQQATQLPDLPVGLDRRVGAGIGSSACPAADAGGRSPIEAASHSRYRPDVLGTWVWATANPAAGPARRPRPAGRCWDRHGRDGRVRAVVIAQTYDFRPLRRVARTMPLACSRGRGTDFRPRRNRAGEARSCSCTVETGACERWDSADLRFSTLAPRCRSHARVGARRFSTEFSRGRVVDPRGTEENVQLCAPLPHVRDTGAIGRMHRKV